MKYLLLLLIALPLFGESEMEKSQRIMAEIKAAREAKEAAPAKPRSELDEVNIEMKTLQEKISETREKLEKLEIEANQLKAKKLGALQKEALKILPEFLALDLSVKHVSTLLDEKELEKFVSLKVARIQEKLAGIKAQWDGYKKPWPEGPKSELVRAFRTLARYGWMTKIIDLSAFAD